MKSLSELSLNELAAIVEEIRDILWKDPVTGRLDPRAVVEQRGDRVDR